MFVDSKKCSQIQNKFTDVFLQIQKMWIQRKFMFSKVHGFIIFVNLKIVHEFRKYPWMLFFKGWTFFEKQGFFKSTNIFWRRELFKRILKTWTFKKNWTNFESTNIFFKTWTIFKFSNFLNAKSFWKSKHFLKFQTNCEDFFKKIWKKTKDKKRKTKNPEKTVKKKNGFRNLPEGSHRAGTFQEVPKIGHHVSSGSLHSLLKWVGLIILVTWPIDAICISIFLVEHPKFNTPSKHCLHNLGGPKATHGG